jgi:hypothetical protein
MKLNVVRWISTRFSHVYNESTCIRYIKVDSGVWQCARQCAEFVRQCAR